MKISVLYLVVAIIGLGLTTANDIDEKIFNGYQAVKGQFPYQALLGNQRSDGLYNCGGSLISKSWVLTAAHCTQGAIKLTVNLGIIDKWNKSDGVEINVPLRNIYDHPYYDYETNINDISLLKLSKPITMNQYIATINLPKLAQAHMTAFQGRMATASGWGQVSDDPNRLFDRYLQFITVRVMSTKECAVIMNKPNDLVVNEGSICTDKTAVFGGPCPGDSGGPLTVNGTDGKPVVIGAVSWGIKAYCENEYPVVYANVAYYLRWINMVSGIPIS